MTAALSAATLEGLVGSTFRVVGPWSPADDGPGEDASPEPDPVAAPPTVELTLTKVVELGHPGPFAQFRATFVGPSSAPLEQGTFVLDPPPGGLDAMLIVPTAEHGDERVYTASLSVRRDQQKASDHV